MITILAEKPSIVDDPQEGDVYYMLFDDDGPYAYVTLNYTYPPTAILHLEVKRFTHNLLKSAIKDDWAYLMDRCKDKGCFIVHVQKGGSFESNATWMKFIRHFGFDNFVQFTASAQFIGDQHG
jgi:hypothetical protein